MKHWNRALAFILAACMALGSTPQQVLAQAPGTESDPAALGTDASNLTGTETPGVTDQTPGAGDALQEAGGETTAPLTAEITDLAAPEKAQSALEPVTVDDMTQTEVAPVPEYLPETEEWAAIYADRLFSLYPIAMFGFSAGEGLEEADKFVYDAARPMLIEVGSGQRTVAKTTVTRTLTPADLGVDRIYELGPQGGAVFTLEARERIFNYFNLQNISDALLMDLPECYWSSKKHGVVCQQKASAPKLYARSGELSPQEVVLTYTLNFPVAENYQKAGGETVTFRQENKDVTVIIEADPAKTGRAITALNNAKAVAAAHADKGDREKLEAFKNYICDAVDYDSAAAANPDTASEEAWQLVYVFDEDPDTKVVCEGYSKAFQYLCDLSTFTDTEVMTQIGTMAVGSTSGLHMWNVVTIGLDTLLADITNSDAGTVGQNGSLFLAPADEILPNGYRVNGVSYTDDGLEPITKKSEVTPEITPPQALNPTYNQGPQDLITPGQAPRGSFQYRLSEKDTWTDEIPQGTEAGTYTVYYQFIYKDVSVKTGSLQATIKPMPISVTVDPIDPVEYTGSQLKPSVVVCSEEALDPETDYTVAYGENIHVSTGGTVTVSPGSHSSYTFEAQTVSFAITPMTVDTSALSWIASSLSYTGREQQITLADVPQGVSVTYTGNTGTEVGGYTAEAALKPADTDHRVSNTSLTLEWTIDPAVITGSISQSGSLTYDSTEKFPAVDNRLTAQNDQPITVQYGMEAGKYPLDSVPGFTEAGEYTVYFKAAAPNHRDLTGSFPVTVSQAEIPVSGWVWDYAGPGTYTGDPQSVALRDQTSNPGLELVTITYSGNQQTAAGAYEATAAAVPKDSRNYCVTGQIPSLTWKIGKASLTPAAAPEITAPAAGAAPQTAAAGEHWTAAIEWQPAAETFAFHTAYTARVTLTPDGNHSFTDEAAGSTGLTDAVRNGDGTITGTLYFPATRKAKLTSVTPPAAPERMGTHADPASALAELPGTVAVTAEDGTTALNVTWQVEGTYDPSSMAVNTYRWTADPGDLDGSGVTLIGSVKAANMGNVLQLQDPALASQSGAWVDGTYVPLIQTEDGAYLDLPGEACRSLVTYSFHNSDSADPHTQYPTGMQVWLLEKKNGTYEARHVPELDDLLIYAGSSIRVAGKKGIRMITGVETEKKNALIENGVAGCRLLEYGTALAWSSDLQNGHQLVLGDSTTRSNYAYRRDVADPVFRYADGQAQYTNVLVGFSDDDCSKDIAMRSYVILEDANGETVTLYGGIVHRSIGYIAYQNRNAFPEGSDAYDYVWHIIHHVYGNQFD